MCGGRGPIHTISLIFFSVDRDKKNGRRFVCLQPKKKALFIWLQLQLCWASSWRAVLAWTETFIIICLPHGLNSLIGVVPKKQPKKSAENSEPKKATYNSTLILFQLHSKTSSGARWQAVAARGKSLRSLRYFNVLCASLAFSLPFFSFYFITFLDNTLLPSLKPVDSSAPRRCLCVSIFPCRFCRSTFLFLHHHRNS